MASYSEPYKQDASIDGHYRNNICFNCEEISGLKECTQTKKLCPLLQDVAERRREVYDFIARKPCTVGEIVDLIKTDIDHVSGICTVLMKSSLIFRENGKWTAKK